METHSNDALLKRFLEQFRKSQGHLQYSFRKVQKLTLINEQTPEEELEVWESFASRFARTSDLLIAKVLRRLILTKDPAFRGSVIDLLNEAEKFSWIADALQWRRIRELRNIAAHEYAIDDLQMLYKELINLSPIILDVKL
jgi:hypothetical protein